MRSWLFVLAGLAMLAVAAESADTDNDDFERRHDHDGGDSHEDTDDRDEVPYVTDKDRACPDGFLYAGEPSSIPASHHEERWQVWEEGPASPVYSCYALLNQDRPVSLSGASLGCNQLKGQLISINQFLEDSLLTGGLFIDRLKIIQNDASASYLTSGINYDSQAWSWFGADEPISSSLVGQFSGNTSTNSTNSTQLDGAQCLTIRWQYGGLVFSPTPCSGQFSHAICEVRAYTQTWYVWFYVNWMQILFFFTLVSLILASCCLFQTWFTRPDRRRGRVVQGHMQAAPPPYSLHQSTTSQNRARAAAANYARKGRDILAKVTFYKPAEEKQPLP